MQLSWRKLNPFFVVRSTASGLAISNAEVLPFHIPLWVASPSGLVIFYLSFEIEILLALLLCKKPFVVICSGKNYSISLSL